VAVAVAVLPPAPAGAQPRTDVVTLANGDRLTGEVVRMERGRLEFKTDDAGTLYLEWDKLTGVVTTRTVEVITTDGFTFVGSLAPAAVRAIAVVAVGTTTLATAQVTSLTTIGRGFWRRLEGSIDGGFSYTQSSGIAQLNLNQVLAYRQPGFQARFTASVTQTDTDDESNEDDRGAAQLEYLRYAWPRWFVTVVGRVETNESLGVELRSQVGGGIGPRLVNTNRAQLTVGAGVTFSDELGVDVERQQNVDALLLFNTSYYTYDRPRTNLDVTLQYYKSLNERERHRVQLDAAVKREFWKDLFLALSLYDSYDSRPPNPDAARNDVGVVTSIGWTY